MWLLLYRRCGSPANTVTRSAKANRRRNLLLKSDVDRVVKRFEALHAPVSKEALDAFASTLDAECRSRETVRPVCTARLVDV